MSVKFGSKYDAGHLCKIIASIRSVILIVNQATSVKTKTLVVYIIETMTMREYLPRPTLLQPVAQCIHSLFLAAKLNRHGGN